MLFAAKEKGQGLVEYALILVLVAIVVIVALTALGPIIGRYFQQHYQRPQHRRIINVDRFRKEPYNRNRKTPQFVGVFFSYNFPFCTTMALLIYRRFA